MTDKLKTIWAGFEETTSRHLTGSGVDNILVPHRVDYAAEDETFLPENFDAPAEAAFSALREKLKKQERKFGRKNRQEDLAPLDASQNFAGDELVKGMKATAMRTERPERDYANYLNSDAGKAALKRHKKKRFIFF